MRRTVVLAIIVIAPVLLGAAPDRDGPTSRPAYFESKPTEEKTKLDPVVVTASRRGWRLFETDRSLETVERAELDRLKPASLPDALRETAGVFVQRTNRGSGAPIIRGLVGPYNLILLDGFRINNSTYRTGPNQYLALFDPWGLERIEVMRGPGSVLHGSDAVGGVIHLFSREADAGKRGWAMEARGRFASGDLAGAGGVRASIRGGPLAGEVGASFWHFGELRVGRGGKELLSSFNRASWRAKLVHTIDDRSELRLAYFATRTLDAGRTDRIGIGRYRFYDNSDDIAYLRYDRKGDGPWPRVSLGVSYHHAREIQDQYRCATIDGLTVDIPACAAGDLDTLTRHDHGIDTAGTFGITGTLEWTAFDSRLRVVTGGELYHDGVHSKASRATADSMWLLEPRNRGAFSDDSTYLTSGLFAWADADLMRGAESVLAVNAGVRLAHFATDAAAVPGIGDVRHRFTGGVVTGGVRWLYLDNLNLYMNFSQGFRAPNLEETTVLGDTGSSFDIPNDALRPERSNVVEVGVRTGFPWLGLHVAGYVNWLQDVIERDLVAPEDWMALGIRPEDVAGLEVRRRANLGNALYRGIEAHLILPNLWRFRVWARVSMTWGDITHADGELEPARRVPPPFGGAGLRYDDPDALWHAEVYLLWAAAQRRLNAQDESDLRICGDPDAPGLFLDPCAGTSSWVTLNARAGMRPHRFLSVDLSIENLTDARYKTHGSGLFAPGFNAIVSATLTY